MGGREERKGRGKWRFECVCFKKGRTVWKNGVGVNVSYFFFVVVFPCLSKIINTYEIEINRRSIDDYMKVLCICRMLSLAHQQNEFEVDSSMPWCYCENGGQKIVISRVRIRKKNRRTCNQDTERKFVLPCSNP